MKKKFSLVFLVVFSVMLCVTAYGATPYEYGDSFFSLKMNGSIKDEDYWYLYYGKNGSEISEENAYEGKTSLKCDIDKIKVNDNSYPFMLHTRSVSNNNGISDNDIYCEVYTSSTDEVFNNLTFAVYFDMPNGSQRVIKNFTSEFVNDKWRKNYCVIDVESVKGFSSCHIGVLYKKNNTLSGVFYVDNITMRVTPKTITANDVFVEGCSADLKGIRVFGNDKYGDKNLITDKKSTEFRVIDGNAEIIDNMLLYRAAQPGNVILEADFLGKKSTFSVYFENKGICFEEKPVVQDDEVCCTLTNNSDTGADITGFVLIYDDDGLYNAHMFTKTLLAGETQEIKEKINVPNILNNPKIKCFFWNNSGGISEIIDVDYN